MSEVQVIGAGLSGLATAWYLTDAGVRVHVIEARPRPGGLLETCHEAEGLVERAAQAFTWTRQVMALFEAVGIQPCFAQPQSRRRYIVRNAKPRRWPLSPVESAAAAARLASAWARRRTRPRDRETVASWGRRVVGAAATTWLIAPALQGVYASSPDVLSARAVFGSGRRLRGALAAPIGGMGELVDRLHARLGERGVTFEFGAPVDRIDSSAPVVVCTDAPAASRLLAPQAPGVARAIARIRQVALRPVTAFFEPTAGDLCGFGVLFPRGERVGALGAVFGADVFPRRSALRLETWIYGDVSADALPGSEAAVRRQLAADRRILTGRDQDPVAVYPSPAPALVPLYDEAVLMARAALADLPTRVAIVGNYLGRLGVSGLVESAHDSATRLAAALRG
jgi:oxygen-dependent protoporphyrinogen oxidase